MNNSIGFILDTVANEFGLEVKDLMPRNRNLDAIEARQTAMFVLWNSTEHTLKEIGEALDGRSPATISNGYQQIARIMGSDNRLKHKVDRIVAEINGGVKRPEYLLK